MRRFSQIAATFAQKRMREAREVQLNREFRARKNGDWHAECHRVCTTAARIREQTAAARKFHYSAAMYAEKAKHLTERRRSREGHNTKTPSHECAKEKIEIGIQDQFTRE
jgi:hypothetical protein